MIEQKYQVGQEVEATYASSPTGYRKAIVQKVIPTYLLVFSGTSGQPFRRDEEEIRPHKNTPEEAWQKAAIIVGQRSIEKEAWLTQHGVEVYNTETRHQCYQLLGAAGIKVTDEVKAEVRRLIDLADML